MTTVDNSLTTIRPALGLILWIGLCLTAASIGSLLTVPAIPVWYQTLAKPVWTPPSWLFAPVWTVLYLMMGTAAWLVWRPGGWMGAPVALGWFLVQLALNIAWSGLFFKLRMPGLAFLEIVVLWLAIVATLWWFARYSAPAAWLLTPYLAWVTFAAVLNLSIWRMNR